MSDPVRSRSRRRGKAPILGAAAGFLLAVAALAAPAPAPAPSPLGTDTPLPGRDRTPGWYVRIDTSLGAIVARLHPENAPQSVAHFAALADGRLGWTDVITGEQKRGNYFDGMIVYRADAGQSFESGDPYGTGNSAPDVWVPPEVGRPIDFTMPWRIGLVRAALGRVTAAQYFITAASLPSLNPRHPCIGTVIEGKQVVRRIADVKTYSNGKPIDEITVRTVRVFAVGDPAPLPDPVPFKPVLDKRLRVKEQYRQQ